MERRVIDIFRDDHMCQQPFRGERFLHGLRRRRRFHHILMTVRAGVFRADRLDDDKAGRLVFELLRHRLTDARLGVPARALFLALRQIELDAAAWQLRGQRPGAGDASAPICRRSPPRNTTSITGALDTDATSTGTNAGVPVGVASGSSRELAAPIPKRPRGNVMTTSEAGLGFVAAAPLRDQARHPRRCPGAGHDRSSGQRIGEDQPPLKTGFVGRPHKGHIAGLAATRQNNPSSACDRLCLAIPAVAMLLERLAARRDRRASTPRACSRCLTTMARGRLIVLSTDSEAKVLYLLCGITHQLLGIVICVAWSSK